MWSIGKALKIKGLCIHNIHNLWILDFISTVTFGDLSSVVLVMPLLRLRLFYVASDDAADQFEGSFSIQ